MTEFILNAMEDSIRSRHAAAETLAKVADAGSTGSWPSDVTCEELGEALERIMLNAPGSDPLAELIQGYRVARDQRVPTAETCDYTLCKGCGSQFLTRSAAKQPCGNCGSMERNYINEPSARPPVQVAESWDVEEDFDEPEDSDEEDECPFDAYDDWDDYVDDGHDFSGQ